MPVSPHCPHIRQRRLQTLVTRSWTKVGIGTGPPPSRWRITSPRPRLIRPRWRRANPASFRPRRKLMGRGLSPARGPGPRLPGVLHVADSAVLREVLLVVFLGRPEVPEGLDLRHDLSRAEPLGRLLLTDERLGLAFLLVAGRPDPGTVLLAPVGTLPVRLCRVVHREEGLEEPPVGDPLRGENDLDGLGVPGPPAADLFVRNVVDVTLGVAAGRLEDPWAAGEVVLNAPEAPPGEVGGLGLHRLTVGRERLPVLDELQRRRVEAVALPRRLRTVVKNVPLVRPAPRAGDLGPRRPEGRVGVPRHMRRIELPVEAGPSGPGVELVPAREEGEAADDARVEPLLVVVEEGAAERRLRPRLLGDPVRLRVELRRERLHLLRQKRRDVVPSLRVPRLPAPRSFHRRSFLLPALLGRGAVTRGPAA